MNYSGAGHRRSVNGDFPRSACHSPVPITYWHKPLSAPRSQLLLIHSAARKILSLLFTPLSSTNAESFTSMLPLSKLTQQSVSKSIVQL